MYFYISVYSGLNNKLIPLLSLLRIANKENKKIKCYWSNKCWGNKSISNNYHFLDLFESIENIDFIDKNEFNKMYNSKVKIYNKNGSDRDRNEIIYKPSGDLSIVFYNIVHPISYKEDNVLGYIVPYPKETKSITPFITDFREVIKKLIPKQHILSKINNFIKKIDLDNTIAVHIRLKDGGFRDIKYKDVESYIYSIKDKKIYLACDSIDIENKLKSKFNNIIVFDLPFGDYNEKFMNNSNGLKNTVCELFILSKFKTFFGTPGSSFSLMVWLLSDNKNLEFWCDDPWK